MLGVVAHAFNPNTPEAKASGISMRSKLFQFKLKVLGQPRLPSETWSTN